MERGRRVFGPRTRRDDSGGEQWRYGVGFSSAERGGRMKGACIYNDREGRAVG
jgi:hypothetical protein